jgi:hypothetical protein
MRSRFIGLAAALIALLGAVARADDLAPFHAALENVAAHNRAALGHLAERDAERASAELRQMQDAWGAFTQRFSGGSGRPDAFRDNKLYVTMLVDVPTRIVAAMMMIDFGRLAIAQSSLQAIRREISAVRRESGIEVLADAVLDANDRLEPLAAYGAQPPGWDMPAATADIAAKADAYRAALRHCDELAPGPVRTTPEFRHILDRATAALAALSAAVAARDGTQLRLVIDELRSLDSLLAARYG